MRYAEPPCATEKTGSAEVDGSYLAEAVGAKV